MNNESPNPQQEKDLEDVLFDAVPALGSMPLKPGIIFTPAQLTALNEHLRNDNAPLDVAMGFRDAATGKAVYRKSATKTYGQLSSWAISTMRGKAKPGREISLVAYASNPAGQSRWGAMDFDAHHGEIKRAYNFACDAYHHLKGRNVPGVVLFLEHTGAGGWHVWLVSLEFHPCAWWTGLLKEVATAIGAPVQPGVCEIFPHESNE